LASKDIGAILIGILYFNFFLSNFQIRKIPTILFTDTVAGIPYDPAT